MARRPRLGGNSTPCITPIFRLLRSARWHTQTKVARARSRDPDSSRGPRYRTAATAEVAQARAPWLRPSRFVLEPEWFGREADFLTETALAAFLTNLHASSSPTTWSAMVSRRRWS